MDDKFDIYCVTKFSLSEPRFSRLCAADPVARLIGNLPVIDENGYLGVSLTQLESLWMVKVLRGMGFKSYPIPERYKSLNISNMEARRVAQKFIMGKRAQKPDCDFADVEEISVLWWLSKIAYGYFSKSDKMMRDGIAPPGITVCIDRMSGLVMQERQLINAELVLLLTE